MAEEKLQFVLELATRATGDGAQRVADDMARVNRAIAANTDKAKVSEFAYYDLGTAIDRTRKQQEKIPAANNQVRVSSRNTSMALLELSRGFEDAQYGIRGVLNNIPSLVLSLGGTAGLAGGISIAAVALSQLAPLFTTTAESADEAAAKVKELTTRMGEAEGRRFDQVAESLDAARERAKALAQDWDDTSAAEKSFSASAITNAESVAKAQQAINAALGIQTDRLKELAAIAELEAQKRADAAQASLKAENERRQKAEQAVQAAALDLQAQQNRAEQERQNLASLRERLALLEQEKLALQKIASADAARSAATQGPFSSPTSYQTNQEAADARANLQSPQFNAGIDGLKARISSLEENLLSLTKDGGVLTRAETALVAAQTQLVDVNRAVEIKSAEIVQNFQTADITGKVAAIGDRTKAVITGIEEGFSQIQTTNQQGQAAVERTKAAIADGVLTAAESEQLSKDMLKLIGLMQTGQATNRQSVMNMINLQTSTNAELNRINGELLRLNAVVSQIERK